MATDAPGVGAGGTARGYEPLEWGRAAELLLDPWVLLAPVRDAEGAIVDFVFAAVNAAACDDQGLAREQMVGARLLELLPGLDEAGLLRTYAQAFESGEPLVLDDMPYPNELLGVTRHYDVRAVSVDSGLSFSWRDVTERIETHERLVASEERFRRAMTESAVGMCLVSPDGRFLEVNDALCDLFGLDRPTLLTRTWQVLTHPDDLQTDLALVERLLAGEMDHYRLRKRFLRSDGGVVDGDLTVSAIRTPDGTVDYFVSQIVDVTQEVRARRDLETARAEADEARAAATAAAQEFRMLAENASDVVYRVGPDGRCQWVSPSVTDLLGWQREDWVGRGVATLIHPDDLAVAEKHRASALKDPGAPPRRLEMRYATVDARWRWMATRSRVLLDDDGAVVGGVTALRDIHGEVEARDRLLRSEEDYRAVAENSSDVVVRSRDGIVDWVSPSLREYFGFRPQDVVGSDIARFAHPEDLPRVIAERRHLAPDRASTVRYRMRRANGEWRWVEAQSRQWRDRVGDVQGVVTSIRDVDEAVRAEVALERSQTLLRSTLDALLDPWVMMTAVRDSLGRIVDFEYADANPAACKANGLPYEDLLGRRLLDLFPEHEPRGLLAAYASVVDTGQPLVMDDVPFPDARSGGQVRWFDNRAVKVGEGISFTWRDVTDRYEARQREARRARQDPLTGLANRTELLERIGELMQRVPRTGAERAILFCDLDHFKDINDTRGHAAGDAVLRTAAHRIAGSVRGHDVVARIGGDEFVVVLDGIHDHHDAVAVAEKIRSAVAAPMAIDDAEERVSVSIGIALAAACDDPADCLARADEALYRAKVDGRDRVVVD